MRSPSSHRSISRSRAFAVSRSVRRRGAVTLASKGWQATKFIAKFVWTARANGAPNTPDYWRRYREKNPAAVAHNREQQQRRDRKQRLLDLANNNSALDLKHSAASIWLLNAGAEGLANNNSVSARVWVIEPLPPRKGPGREPCKQQRAGVSAESAG